MLVLLAVTANDWTNFGALGAVVAAFMAGLVVAKPTVDRLDSQLARALDQRDSIVRDVVERVVPVLERAITTIDRQGDVREVLVDVRRLLEQQKPQ